MKKKMLRRTTLREIRGSFGRFFAILAIIALGVGFFSGVRITTPAMVETVNDFWQEKQLFDYRLVSTLGWEEQDVESFRALTDVRYAEGSHTMDILCNDKDKNEFVLKSHTIPEHLNLLELTEGRMPQAADECIMDAGMPGSLHVGDTVYVADENEKDTLEALRFREFRIVGAAHSALYANFERGTASLGNGSVSGYLYLSEDAYDLDYYTEIWIRFNHDYPIYSDEYKHMMQVHDVGWGELTQEIADERYTRVRADALEELDEAKQKLADARADGEEELADAQQELSDGKRELDDAKKELDDARKELDDAKQELDDANAELHKAKKELSDGKKQIADAKAELDNAKAQLDASSAQIAEGEAALVNGQAQLDAARQELEANAAALRQQENALAQQEQQVNASMAMYDMLPPEQKAQLDAAQQQIRDGRAQIEAGKAQIEAGRTELDQQQSVLDAKRTELEQGKAEFEKGSQEYTEGLAKYEQSLIDYDEGWQKYQDGRVEYNDGLRKYNEGLEEYNDGKAEYEKAEQEYLDGLAEYEDGKAEFDEKIADAEEEIADAEEKIDDIDHPDTYVLDRGTNISYACFESDSEIVAQVARVFPVFFILVAALVCMTTMSRMVEEQRTQIGVLKALGYSEGDIMGKFMFYSGAAAVLGCVIGYAIGIVLFPSVIWMSYELMYIPLPLHIIIDWKLAGLAIAASLLCSLGTTWLSCRIELAETAAGLMRPKAPKAGKRVLLEYVPFLWNRLKFLHKVSIRNIFRYKGRFFMMVLGIGGCTALLLTGLGLRDSVAGFADVQYGDIQIADASMLFRSSMGGVIPEKLRSKMDELTDDYILLHEASWDLVTADKTKGMDLIVPLEGSLDNYMVLRTLDGEPLAVPGSSEALVSNSIAERYGAVEGTTITLRNEDMQEIRVTVTGVFENHVYNYIILSPDTFADQLGEVPQLNGAYLNFPEGQDEYQIQAELAKDRNVTSVSLFSEVKARMAKMMSSLDYIVLLVIFCAAGLAFIVLYNLTNINITERIREIATIKVLGFFRNETSAYVLRENLALTAIGTILGLGLGVLLHRFVMAQIIVDLVSFRVRVLPMSFAVSIVLTFVFNFIVNLFMGIKLDRINMAESLKSVD